FRSKCINYVCFVRYCFVGYCSDFLSFVGSIVGCLVSQMLMGVSYFVVNGYYFDCLVLNLGHFD
ncbi:hypothetical protein, partial [Lentilactobacillus parakefiri]|uniref:hypothetical protein n=1 Tax=Lentilactobacillus parakefiri TaxID=152332 RepID=UPI001CDAFD58